MLSKSYQLTSLHICIWRLLFKRERESESNRSSHQILILISLLLLTALCRNVLLGNKIFCLFIYLFIFTSLQHFFCSVLFRTIKKVLEQHRTLFLEVYYNQIHQVLLVLTQPKYISTGHTKLCIDPCPSLCQNMRKQRTLKYIGSTRNAGSVNAKSLEFSSE